MKKNLMRVITCAVSLVIAASALSGCGGSQKKSEDAGQAKETGKPNTPVELTMWSSIFNILNGTQVNLGEVEAFKELEKRTGVKVKFTHPAAGQEGDQFNLMMASNSLPDMIMSGWAGGVGTKYGTSKQILSLNDQLDKNATNLKAVLTKYPDAKKQLTDPDGKIYYFPFIRGDATLRVYNGLMVRKDWLDRLGLQVPTTTEEFYNMLKAFKDRDPNGNGKADEIPFIAETIAQKPSGFDRLTFPWGVSMFYVDGGKVKYGFMQPEFKDALQWQNKLYKEGLIDPDYMITDRKQFDSKVSNGQAGCFYGMAGGTLGRLMTLMQKTDPKFNLVGIPYLKGPDGKPYNLNPEIIQSVNGLGIAITSSCKNVPEAVKWADYAYGKEGNLLLNFGIEGKSYTMVNNIPTYTDEIMKNPQGLSNTDAIGKYAIPFGWALDQDINYFNQVMDKQRKDAIGVWKQAVGDRALPTLNFTPEESKTLSTLWTEIDTYQNQMIPKFVMGNEPIANFDKFVEKLKAMKIDEVVSVYQKAMDRYNK